MIFWVVPSITWTFEVTTDDSINAGVVFKEPNWVKAKVDDFWVKENGTWTLNRASSGSFAPRRRITLEQKFLRMTESTILNYIPDPGFTGKNIVKYTVSDGKGGSASAQVEFFVGTDVVIDTGDSGDGGDTEG